MDPDPLWWRKVLEEERVRVRKVVDEGKERTGRMWGEAVDRDRMGAENERKGAGPERLKERPKSMSMKENNLLGKDQEKVGKDEAKNGKDMKGGEFCEVRGKKRRSELGKSEKKTGKNSAKADISMNLPKNCCHSTLMDAIGKCQVVLEARHVQIQDNVATLCVGEDDIVSVFKKLERLRIGGQGCRLLSSGVRSQNIEMKIVATETVMKNTRKIEGRKDSAANLDVKDATESEKKVKVPVMFPCMDIREKYKNT